MALTECPECGREVSDRARACPHCGLPMSPGRLCYEYRSRGTLFGLPLVHVVLGYAVDPATARFRVAKGIVAVGHIALGVVAVGGLAVGGVAIGGLALGLALALGGCAVGAGLSLGGLAVGTVALGGLAVGYYALGGAAFGAHPLGGNVRDPEAVEFFSRFLGSWLRRPPPAPPSS